MVIRLTVQNSPLSMVLDDIATQPALILLPRRHHSALGFCTVEGYDITVIERVGNLLKFLAFRSVHFTPADMPDPPFDFSRVWFRDYVVVGEAPYYRRPDTKLIAIRPGP